MSDELVPHLERHLGTIAGGWSHDAGGTPLPFQVVWFSDAPEPGLVTYATLGLSRHVFDAGAKKLRHELLLTVQRPFMSDRVLSALVTVGETVLERHRPLLRGEVVGMSDGLREGSALDAFYVSAPVLLPDSFAVLTTTDPPTVFAWLVPVTAAEADLVKSHGWPWFEHELEAQQPPLTDLARGPIAH